MRILPYAVFPLKLAICLFAGVSALQSAYTARMIPRRLEASEFEGGWVTKLANVMTALMGACAVLFAAAAIVVWSQVSVGVVLTAIPLLATACCWALVRWGRRGSNPTHP